MDFPRAEDPASVSQRFLFGCGKFLDHVFDVDKSLEIKGALYVLELVLVLELSEVRTVVDIPPLHAERDQLKRGASDATTALPAEDPIKSETQC